MTIIDKLKQALGFRDVKSLRDDMLDFYDSREYPQALAKTLPVGEAHEGHMIRRNLIYDWTGFRGDRNKPTVAPREPRGRLFLKLYLLTREDRCADRAIYNEYVQELSGKNFVAERADFVSILLGADAWSKDVWHTHKDRWCGVYRIIRWHSKEHCLVADPIELSDDSRTRIIAKSQIFEPAGRSQIEMTGQAVPLASALNISLVTADTPKAPARVRHFLFESETAEPDFWIGTAARTSFFHNEPIANLCLLVPILEDNAVAVYRQWAKNGADWTSIPPPLKGKIGPLADDAETKLFSAVLSENVINSDESRSTISTASPALIPVDQARVNDLRKEHR